MGACVGYGGTVRRLLLAAAVLAAVAVGSASGASRGAAGLGPTQIASGFASPTQVTAPRGSRGILYVVEQPGRIRVLVNGRLRAQPFLDIRKLIRSGGEQGLLGLAFAPDYAKSRLFVVDYTDLNGNTRVVRYRSNGTRAIPTSAKQLLFVRQPYENHNGGQVAFGPDGKLYVGMGDGGSGGDPGNRAQNMGSRLGKILRLGIAKPGAAPKVVALGVRNPWRFSFDRVSGDLWIGDVGQSRVEEVDHLAWPLRGLLNLGWRVYEGRDSYQPGALGPGTLTWPVATYTHDEGCSITGGFVYRGTAVPAFVGRYIYGDYCSGTIWSLELANGAAQVRKEPFTIPNPTSFGEDGSGELYAASANGTIYRLTAPG